LQSTYSSPLSSSGKSAATKRALGHSRVSTDEQAEKGFGLDDQDEQIRTLCQANGWNLIGIIPDDFTGRTLDRPGYTEVRELARARAFEILVCPRLDRLARKNYLRRLAEVELSEYGIEVVFATQRFDNSATGRFQKGVMGEVAELEAELIKERTVGGRNMKANGNEKKGIAPAIPVGAEPYGFWQVRRAQAEAIPEYHGRSGELILISEKVDFIRELFQRAARGEALRTLATWATATSHKPRKGGVWTAGSLRVILKNPVYYGEAVYGRRRIVELSRRTKSGKHLATRHELRPESEWKRVACPAVVTRELWEAVQERLSAGKTERAGRPSALWPLSSGVTVCGVCIGKRGDPLHAAGGKDRRGVRRYECSSRRRPDVPFCRTQFSAEVLEAKAKEKIRWALAPGRLEELAREEAERANAAAGNPEEQERALQAQIKGLAKETESIFERAKLGFDAAFIQAKVAEVNERRAALERELATVRAAAARLRDPEAAAQAADRIARRLAAGMEKELAPPEGFKRLARLLLRIELYPDRNPVIEVGIPDELALPEGHPH
jgi:site-specific DNA recombinase